VSNLDSLIFGGEYVRFPPEVLAPDHAQQLVDQSWSRIDPALLSTRPRGRATLTTSTAALADRLFQAASRVTQPALPRFPGARGAVAVRAKAALIRVLYWYVEPRWTTQAAFNRVSSEAVKALTVELAVLKKDLRQSVIANRKLRQELETLRDHLVEQSEPKEAQ
jgi:hypothetical protein